MEMVGTIQELCRYPVKSMQGEQLPSLTLGPTGVVGDRAWAVKRVADGKIISAKEKAGECLLTCRAWFEDDVAFMEVFEGACLPCEPGPLADSVLSEFLGFPAQLIDTRVQLAPTPVNYHKPFSLRAGVGVDSSEVHILSEATLTWMLNEYPEGDWSVRRFRPNLLIAGDLTREEMWTESIITLGQRRDPTRLMGRKLTPRCSMTRRAQPGLASDPRILKTIEQRNNGNLGSYAMVLDPGPVVIRDLVFVN